MPLWLSRFIRFLKALLGWTPAVNPAPPPPLPPQQPLPIAGDPPQYRKRDSLMTYQERRFYRHVLLRVVDQRQYVIFSKVRLGDLVYVVREPTDSRYFVGETWSKHIDFVLCDRRTLEPQLAIELDDSSHRKFDNQARDAVKDRVCADAELPLLRIKVVGDYLLDEIAAQIRTLLPEPEAAENQDSRS